MESTHAQRTTGGLLGGMALALALFYWGGTLLTALAGLGLFGILALVRPDLALLFVPFTVPLYLIPGSLPGLRANGFALFVHEAALLLSAGASGVHLLRRRGAQLPWLTAASFSTALRQYAPHTLFLLAGIIGVLLAVARGPALIEFRRLIVEPLLFYALARQQLRHWPTKPTIPALISALVAAGAVVGLLALLQYSGLDIVPLLGKKQCFAPDGSPCQNIITDGGVRRVQSVYGHPNNLGLFLGRVWPLAATLTLLWYRWKRPWLRWFGALSTCLCLGGLVVSFSRGAWLGALAAAAVLAFGAAQPWLRRSSRGTLISAVLGMAVVLAVLGGLALSLRGDVRSGSTPVRLLLWEEALGYLRIHPLGIGLDQFATYHDPKSGLSLINPVLIGTSEQYAAHPHNLLLDIALRLGPLGLIAFAWLLWRFFRTTFRARQALLLGITAAMVAALAHGLVDNFYFVSDLAIVFWLFIAMSESVEPK